MNQKISKMNLHRFPKCENLKVLTKCAKLQLYELRVQKSSNFMLLIGGVLFYSYASWDKNEIWYADSDSSQTAQKQSEIFCVVWNEISDQTRC